MPTSSLTEAYLLPQPGNVKRKNALARADSRRYSPDMNPLPKPDEIEEGALRAGISIAEACRRAGVAASVFHRWKSGKHSPSIRTVEKLRQAVAPAAPDVQE